MKKILFFIAFAMVALIGKAQEVSGDDIIKVGDKMPTFIIQRDNGTTISSETLKGKVVLINLFATWCPPCQKELAFVQQTLWPKFKNNKDFAMWVIGREHNDEELTAYNKGKGFNFPLYPDKNRAIFSKFAKNLIPRSYLIDKSGKVIYETKGFTTEEGNHLMKKIEEALKAK